jgi:hypothetical protein
MKLKGISEEGIKRIANLMKTAQDDDYEGKVDLDFETKLRDDITSGEVAENPYIYIKNNERTLLNDPDRYREYFLNDSQSAFMYANWVDYEPRDDTREAACRDSDYAYLYAFYVDKEPRDDTREAACKDPECAYYYARDVDEKPRTDTFEAVKGTYYENKYINEIGTP